MSGSMETNKLRTVDENGIHNVQSMNQSGYWKIRRILTAPFVVASGAAFQTVNLWNTPAANNNTLGASINATQIIIPVDGVYEIRSLIQFANVRNVDTRIRHRQRINSIDVALDAHYVPKINKIQMNYSKTLIYKELLSAGDTLDIQASLQNGSNRSLPADEDLNQWEVTLLTRVEI